MRRCMLIVLLAFAAPASAADWYNWRGPFHNGVSPETNLPEKWSLDGENLIWKAPYGCRSTPLVLNGRVYFINYAGERESIQERVMCLDADTGKLVWEHKFNIWHTDIVTVRLGWTNIAADPKTGYIYAHGTQGLLFCFDKDGKVVWSRSLSEEFGRISGYGGRLCSPIIDEDLVIIGMLNSSWGDQGKGANRLVAMKKDTGAVVWWGEIPGQPNDTYYAVPVVAVINGERLLITGTAVGSVAALRVRTGELVWNYPFCTTAINVAPVIDGALVYISHGEENPDNNIKGRIICLDAGRLDEQGPKLVWQKDGIKARWCSPILHEGRLYIADEIAKLHCLDAKTGKPFWKHSYGSNARGSPVLADGKIYVGDVNSTFHILKPGDKKCAVLHEEYLPPGANESADVEINGSPAVANGRVYFASNDEFYCIGKKEDAKPAPAPTHIIENIKGDGPIAHVQIFPAEVVVHPGDSVSFQVRAFDAHGNPLDKVASVSWSLPTPKPAPGAKTSPPPLDGQIDGGKLTVDAKKPSQQGYVAAKVGDVVGRARVRVAPRLPYQQDFSKVPDGAVPGGWVNTQGKFLVKTVEGEKVLAKVNDKASPLINKGNAYIGLPSLSNYTIEAEVMGTKVNESLPKIGVVNCRYTLMLEGNEQKLRLVSWDAIPRVDKTVPFKVEPNVWYRMKLTVDTGGAKTTIKGKAWPRAADEPSQWIILNDPVPNTEGSPALFGYVTGNASDGELGTEVYFDNVRVTPNGKK